MISMPTLREIGPMPVHAAPEHTGIGGVARQIADKLNDVPMGSGIECVLPEGVMGTAFRQAIYHECLSRPFSISTRFRDGRICLYKFPPRHYQPRQSDRAADIVSRRMVGETLESIAADYGLTRERIRQISTQYGTFNSLPVTQRIQAVNEYIAPYLDAVPDHPCCVICSGELSKGRGLVCGDCRKFLKIVRDTASRLRAHKNSGKRHYIGKATMLIKRYNLQPLDLKRG